MMKKTMKTGIAASLLQLAAREARKPENQRRAKELLAKARDHRRAQKLQKAR